MSNSLVTCALLKTPLGQNADMSVQEKVRHAWCTAPPTAKRKRLCFFKLWGILALSASSNPCRTIFRRAGSHYT